MANMEQLYQERLARYTTAMRNEQPDRVPLRPFVAEFTGTYAGYTCQQLAHDYENAFAAARRCATDFAWDAVVPNMLTTWTGMTQAMGLRYYMTPGIDLPANVGHQYREPPPEEAWMRADEYDALIEYGVYSRGHAAPSLASGGPTPTADEAQPGTFVSAAPGHRPPGVCVPWSEKRASLGPIPGDEALCDRVWKSVDGLAAMYIWWIALAF